MRAADLDYDLPEEQIAQRPLAERDGSRLLCLERQSGVIEHRRFGELPGLLPPSSLLVVNETRVFPARLLGQRASGGAVELLLLERLEASVRSERWRCLGRPSKKLKAGTLLRFAEVLAEVEEVGDEGVVVELRCEGEIRGPLERIGRIPLPPYIRRSDDAADRERYQTIFAGRGERPESVAAPTAGLHFTDEVVGRLERAGHALVAVSLAVGPGTFRPVRAERLEDHEMDSERFEVGEAAAAAINGALGEGRPVIAVGTTVVRTLESAVAGGLLRAGRGRTALFIRPGYSFQVISGLLTNFHLPRSTLLALVGAFAGLEPVLAAYREAVRLGYRFYSYGDAMLLR